ncbi:glycosyl hydrolase family 17 protein [Dyella sp. GSA-30]|uniref:glycoside hydrolase family 17 protein n=1 Tax=Dyella sp. GSA-30 TaxID=2994496 RepID=UPI002493C87F|nr:glycosyl hydrolase family 17 protein [Dyella sp. GSA-30]BDU19787.1 beta-1,6-glucan synthase [Dyella sp. GSA-30]
MQPLSPPSFRSLWPAWLALVLAALAGAWWWWAIGRPVDLPDAPTSRIACVSYAPFRMPGETPFDLNATISPERIDADLKALSQRFDCVRTYSQSHGLDKVPEIAGRYHMKVLMGMWLSRELKVNAHEIEMGIATAKAHPEVLRGVVVGNEVLLRGELSPKALAAYAAEVRAQIPRSVPITYADVWEFWLRYPQMARAVDYLTIHILPYWEDEPVPPEHAVRHVADVYAKLKASFPGRQIMIGETGWPSAGRPRREASASLVNEARYMREFLAYAGSVDMPYNVIEAFDQPWKRAQEGTVGGYWGIFDVDAQPKFPMKGPVVEESHWLWGIYSGLAAALLFALAGSWRRQWRGANGWLALLLAGFASGTALAWQYRQAFYACRDRLEWSISIGACVLALITAITLIRRIVARLTGTASPHSGLRLRWWRAGWMFALALLGLLLVFDGRYRDFPLGLFALPCIGYAVLGWLDRGRNLLAPLAEERFLAFWLPALAAVVVAQELGLDTSTWLWLGLNLAIALPILIGWFQAIRLKSNQPQAADQ